MWPLLLVADCVHLNLFIVIVLLIRVTDNLRDVDEDGAVDMLTVASLGGRGADRPGSYPPGGDTRRKKLCGQIYKKKVEQDKKRCGMTPSRG